MNPNFQQGYYQQPYGYQPPPPKPPQPEIPMAAKTVKITLGIIAPLIWFIALALPAYNQQVYGVFCLAMGWSMIFTGNILAFFAWFSNLPFFIGFFLFVIGNGRKGKIAAIVLASVALVLSFGALTVTRVIGSDDSPDYVREDFMKPANPAYGMFVWMASYIVLLVGATVFLAIRNNSKNNQLPPEIPPMPENPYPPMDPYAEFTLQYPPELPQDRGENPWEEKENE